MSSLILAERKVNIRCYELRFSQ